MASLSGASSEITESRDSFSSSRPNTSSLLASETSKETSEISDSDIVKHNVVSSSTGQLSEDDTTSILSIVWSGGKLGAAHYDPDSARLYMMADIAEAEDFLILKKLLFQIQPLCVVLSTKQDERLSNHMKLHAQQSSGVQGADFIQILPSIDFSLEICKRRIMALNLPGIPDGLNDGERSLTLSSLVNFEDLNMVRAVGGLLKYLEKWRVGVELEDAGTRIPVLALVPFTLEDIVFMDENSYRALQVFQRESHPSVYKACSNSGKEGLSLFGVVNQCKSQMGAKMLRQWFLHPTRNQCVLTERYDAISFFSNAHNSEITTALTNCVKNIRNIPRILLRMTQGEVSTADWQSLYKTVYNSLYINDICKAQTQQVAIFKKINEVFSDELHKIASLINKIIDFEESHVLSRFVVKPNVNPELDEKKRTYHGLPDFMTQVAREELNRLSGEIRECSVLYLPQLGYLLAIPQTDKIQETSDYSIPGLDFMFLSNNVLHYKSASTIELDKMLGDTQCEITDQETLIMHELQNVILQHSQLLVEVIQCIGHLDCLLALAVTAKECNYVRPELTTDSVLLIKAGRHPLQELCCTPFVPNDTLSGLDHSKIKVLTGPNASGKSIYLKQVALIVFMAHVGSFVPAESATIGLFDGIFTRIRTLESVSVGLSTFMIDLTQVSMAMQQASSRSLVLLDEFGKGTSTLDGVSLLCGCLNHWIGQATASPHVLVSTHFHGLLNENLLPPSQPHLQFMMMDFLQDGDEIVFLYQLTEGSSNKSYACHIAGIAGLPEEIIRRGTEVSSLLQKNLPVRRVDRPSTATYYKRCQTIVSRFLDLDFEKDDLSVFLKDFVLPLEQGHLQP